MPPSEKILTVLVVDDEPIVRNVAMAILEREGYHVQSAVDGQEAVELFEKQPESVGLLLTDLAMPRKNGFELIQEVRAIKPEQPIVVMSGHLPQEEKTLEGLAYVRKPFATQTLLDAVEEGLQAAEASAA